MFSEQQSGSWCHVLIKMKRLCSCCYLSHFFIFAHRNMLDNLRACAVEIQQLSEATELEDLETTISAIEERMINGEQRNHKLQHDLLQINS